MVGKKIYFGRNHVVKKHLTQEDIFLDQTIPTNLQGNFLNCPELRDFQNNKLYKKMILLIVYCESQVY